MFDPVKFGSDNKLNKSTSFSTTSISESLVGALFDIILYAKPFGWPNHIPTSILFASYVYWFGVNVSSEFVGATSSRVTLKVYGYPSYILVGFE